MKLLVYLRDGRTVYFLEKRGRLMQLTTGDSWHEGESIRVARGIWNPITGEYTWRAVLLRHIATNSISVVEEADTLAAAVPQEAIALAILRDADAGRPAT